MTIDRIVPTGDIVDVSPTQRTSAVSSIDLVFTEPIFAFELNDLLLTRDGVAVDLAGAALTSSNGGRNYRLSGLTSLTGTAGSYVLGLAATNDLVDAAGNTLGTPVLNTVWTNTKTNTSGGGGNSSGGGTSGSGPTVTLTDDGVPDNDEIRLLVQGDQVLIDFDGTMTQRPLSEVASLVINSGNGNDTFTLDLAGGSVLPRITFNGGGGNDRIVIRNLDAAFSTYTINYTNATDGTILLGDGSAGSSLTFTGLEPVSIDGAPSRVVFNLPNTANPNVKLEDIGGANAWMRLSGRTFETTDFSVGSATAIVVNGGSGADSITVTGVDAQFRGSVSINGGEGNDTLIGSSYAESFNGGGGNDSIKAGAGNDSLTGGAGNDTLNGEVGDDVVVETTTQNFLLTNAKLTGNGTDTLSNIERAKLCGSDGNNTLDASAFTLGAVSLFGLGGNDTLIGGTGNDSLDGGDGLDCVRQATRVQQTLADSQLTGVGTDTLTAIEMAKLTNSGTVGAKLDASSFSGSVTLEGGAGNDTLLSGSGGGQLNGFAGNDTLLGGNGAEQLLGGAGNDTLDGGGGNDTLRGNAGDDLLRGGDGDDSLFGDDGRDKLLGGEGNDVLDGGIGDDVLSGDVGNDKLLGGAGNDALRGGTGADRLEGGLGNDTLLGDEGPDTILGQGGADRLLPGEGADRIEADSQDKLTGREDTDTLVGTAVQIDNAFVFDFDRLLI